MRHYDDNYEQHHHHHETKTDAASRVDRPMEWIRTAAEEASAKEEARRKGIQTNVLRILF